MGKKKEEKSSRQKPYKNEAALALRSVMLLIGVGFGLAKRAGNGAFLTESMHVPPFWVGWSVDPSAYANAVGS